MWEKLLAFSALELKTEDEIFFGQPDIVKRLFVVINGLPIKNSKTYIRVEL